MGSKRVARTIVVVAAVASFAPHASAAEGVAPAYMARVINPTLRGGVADPLRGVYVTWGTDGTILRSRNGKQWETSYTATAQDLAFAAVDSSRNHWLAVGTAGTLIRSSDGARTWQQMLTPGVTADLHAVVFDSARSAFGRVLVSSDHGASWRVAETSSRVSFTDGYCDSQRGAILLSSRLGEVYRSADGGEQWQTVSFQGGDDRKFLSALRATL